MHFNMLLRMTDMSCIFACEMVETSIRLGIVAAVRCALHLGDMLERNVLAGLNRRCGIFGSHV